MTDREVMQQALEALEDAKALLNSKYSADTMWFAKEITALRACLAEPQTVNEAYEACELLKRMGFKWYELEESWYPSAPAKPEPVAWGLFAKVEGGEFHLQHPVRFSEDDAKNDRSMYERDTVIEIRRLYDRMPTRRPLTDEEIDAVWRVACEKHSLGTTGELVRAFARAIERKITGGNDE